MEQGFSICSRDRQATRDKKKKKKKMAKNPVELCLFKVWAGRVKPREVR